MRLDEFMAVTAERLPRADELVAVCAEVGIRFGADADGKPALLVGDDNRAEGQLLAKLMRREPWRSQVLAATGIGDPQPCREFLWKTGHRDVEDRRDSCFGTWFPTGAFWWRFQGDAQWRPIPGRGGETTEPPETIS